MKIGFTGTRFGMTDEQLDTLRDWFINNSQVTEVHHGDCKGSDEETHNLIDEWFNASIRTIAHPPDKSKWRASCKADEIRKPKPYFDRDRDIVDETEELIGTPGNYEDLWQGSGTWYTIHYAQDKGKKVTIIYPDGSTEVRNA